jgi:hypothetical protein
MKSRWIRIELIGIAVFFLLLPACDIGGGSGSSRSDSSLEENVRSSTLRVGSASSSDLSGQDILQGSQLDVGDRIFFRSSDIEFWQIESVAEIESIVSAKHHAGEIDYAQNHSLEYALGDSVESVVFMPDRDVTVGIDRTDLNPDWADNVAAFVAAGKTGINAIRLDIGSGAVSFEVEGELREVYTADRSATNGINGNSMFFVDEAFLARPILITRLMEDQMISQGARADSLGLGLSAEECTLVEAIHHSSNLVDNETPIDLNGALLVPMDPVDLSGFDPAAETLDIVISWNLADAVRIREGAYVMDDRVSKTCFDFSVSAKRTAK